jgi:SHS2 domain-containing protein
MTAAPPYEFVDAVTSDLSFVARGPTLPALFAAAAEALLAATVEAPDGVAEREWVEVELEEPDLELLLLAFLNELVYRRDAELLLLRPAGLAVDEGPGRVRLRARLVGERLDPRRHRLLAEVKAATAYGLRVARAGAGFEARVTLDV